jgi:glucan 1,3-beta-glucosidase
MATDTGNGGISQLENRYKTFIVSHPRISVLQQSLTEEEQTEKDIAEIAGAGLNFVHIPLAYWAIETCDPSLQRPPGRTSHFVSLLIPISPFQ